MSGSLYCRALAECVIQLRSEGNDDPSCEEIIKCYYSRDLFAGTLLTDTRNQLSAIQRIVREESGLLTCLVGVHYYESKRGGSWREVKPTNIIDARKCLPFGRGVKPHGIKFASGQDDLIYQAATEHHLTSATGSASAGFMKIVNGNAQGYISDGRAGRIIKTAHELAIPESAKLLEDKAE
jgi:hypothetical protein